MSEFTVRERGSLLCMVTECIERAGISNISLDDLRLLAGIEAFFDRETIANAEEAQAVAMLALAANAQKENIHAIRQAFGDGIADHVNTLALPYNAKRNRVRS